MYVFPRNRAICICPCAHVHNIHMTGSIIHEKRCIISVWWRVKVFLLGLHLVFICIHVCECMCLCVHLWELYIALCISCFHVIYKDKRTFAHKSSKLQVYTNYLLWMYNACIKAYQMIRFTSSISANCELFSLGKPDKSFNRHQNSLKSMLKFQYGSFSVQWRHCTIVITVLSANAKCSLLEMY